jgi:bifunctional non-homologous end joining protein LigD
MTLKEYETKRDFRKTSEPTPGRSSRAKSKRPIFVVQEHHATRLHYDFRLEADGVLKSWAVPKGPSMAPAEKRLAVHVEDHPLAYAGFHGTIPKGEYGAGTVQIWDKGTYEMRDDASFTEALEQGRLEFVLHGKQLKGRFALIRMSGRGRGKDNWLLIKMRDEFARPESGADGRPRPKPRSPAKRAKSVSLVRPRSVSRKEDVRFTHLDKIMFPDSGITKGDVIDFYRRIAGRLLPELRDRPVTVEIFPEGIDGAEAPHFWQKHTPHHYPQWIPRIELPSERGKPVQYALVNDEQSLLYFANQNALTFHVWFSRVQHLDRPDFVLFDLDPGQASFGDAVAVARQLHAVLKVEGKQAFVKTSGKTGLHVLVPWKTDGNYDEVRAWALTIAERVALAMPDRSTTERSKARRGKRVYIDVMQNAKGHHAVPAYVLRAVPGAPVSTPLKWNELQPNLDPKKYNLRTIFRRLARQKQDLMLPLAPRFRGERPQGA